MPSIYSFPKSLLDNSETQHYILFEIFDDTSSSVNSTKRSVVRSGDAASEWSDRVRNERDPGKPQSTTYAGDAARFLGSQPVGRAIDDAFTFSESRLSRATTRSGDSIVLPLPQELNISDGWEWEMVGFKKNVAGNLIASAAGFGENFSEVAAQGFSDLQGKIASAIVENADRLFGAQTRTAFNPRKEMLFNEPKNRTVSFKFDLVPRNEAETQAIKDITDLFKFYASPERKGNSSILYKYPAEFQIYFISNGGENPFIAKLARTVLTDIETNYMAAGVASMLKNSSPSRISVSLQFSETELLDRKHYIEEKGT